MTGTQVWVQIPFPRVPQHGPLDAPQDPGWLVLPPGLAQPPVWCLDRSLPPISKIKVWPQFLLASIVSRTKWEMQPLLIVRFRQENRAAFLLWMLSELSAGNSSWTRNVALWSTS